jgi:hypothetical protein
MTIPFGLCRPKSRSSFFYFFRCYCINFVALFPRLFPNSARKKWLCGYPGLTYRGTRHRRPHFSDAGYFLIFPPGLIKGFIHISRPGIHKYGTSKQRLAALVWGKLTSFPSHFLRIPLSFEQGSGVKVVFLQEKFIIFQLKGIDYDLLVLGVRFKDDDFRRR